ncbi:PKD domain-containing protein [bacterium]|nr:PKD domain-containing protein [bacterium]
MRWRVVHPGFCGLVLLPEDGQYVDPVSGLSYFYVLMLGDEHVNLDIVQYGTELPDNSVFMLPEQSAVGASAYPGVAVYTTATPKGIVGVRNLQCSFDEGSSFATSLDENGNAGIPGGKRGAADGFWSGLGLSLDEEPLSIDLHDDLHNNPDGHVSAGRRFLHIDVDSAAGAAPPNIGVLFNFTLAVGSHVELGFETGFFELPANFYLDADGVMNQWEHLGLPELPGIRRLRPATELKVSPVVIHAGNQVLFDATATSVDAPSTLVSCELDPGDGSGWLPMGPDFKLVHIYEQADFYEAQVRVVNSYGYEKMDHQSFYVLDPNADDRIYAIPEKTSCLPGEQVRVTVYTSEAVYPFQFMTGVRMTYAAGNSYVPGSFNCGSPGGATYDIDGIWTQVEPDSFLEVGGALFQQVDIGNGLNAIDFSIVPLYGHDIDLASGPMFSFELEVNNSTPLGFQVENGTLKTMYSNGNEGIYRQWHDTTNAGMPSIVVLP